jgi:hypothetical protein
MVFFCRMLPAILPFRKDYIPLNWFRKGITATTENAEEKE